MTPDRLRQLADAAQTSALSALELQDVMESEAARLLADAMDAIKCQWQAQRLSWLRPPCQSCISDPDYPDEDYCPACALLARFAALGEEEHG